MKRNELVQIKGLSLKELSDKVKTIRQEIEEKVLDKNMKKLKDLKMVSKKRKDLAQVLTILRQKELLEQLSVVSGQLSDKDQSVVSKSVTDKQKTDNRKTGGKK